MKQEYHSNERTNIHMRLKSNKRNLTNREFLNQQLVNGEIEKILKTKVQDRIQSIMP
ncbi:MAG: hypothetical protein PWP52_28 [Bacteroidales bacterium]|nr:hypothetical protein [Bacteroidales bacterium]